ncbi:hypothetical protein MMA231_03987 (plasmid) [Asticcacaulis sp. MM231]|uniref:hypothetical protein n=1 Tax=Asticcacaulis sp. MM231 TaxID=3157666 RepID=UPI0032D57572
MNQTLLPTRILAYIKSDLDDIWRRANITAGALRVALDIDLKPYVVTRSLNEPGKPCEPLWSALQTKKGQEAVAKLFKAPGLFNVESLPELTELLRRVWPTEDRPAKQVTTPKVVAIERDGVQEGWLATNSATEDLLIQRLAAEIDACRLPLIYWPAPRFCGANFISREILPDLDPSKFQRVIAISPSNLNKPYEAELSEVRRAFGVEGRDDESLRALIGKLEESKTLLVVNDYEHFQDEVVEANLSLRRLITLIQRNNLSARTDHPLILFIGSTDVRGQTVLFDVAHCHKLTNLNHLLSVPRPERFDFFMEQFDLFQAKRWHGHLYDHNGFRTKRARLQLNLKNNREKRPIDIRLRALFASNRDNYAYFDPTGGFMKLVGTLDGGIPRQVQRYVDEVALYLKSKTLGMNQADIRVLRWISTAMYWLTVPAIKEFCRVTTYFDFPRAKRILKEDLGDVVQVHPNPESGKEPIMYTAPLGFRAIIQDHWKEEARTYPKRCDRGMTHYIVARRLHNLRHQKVMLNHEFPYEAHWGRSRMYFLSECIRHLVRSVEDAKGFEGEAPKVLGDFPTDIYTRRNGEPVQPNPHEVLSICYEKLFQAELNGNTAGSSGSRALSNRHGAYHLTAELLQLMGSHDGLMTPHWAFPESKHAPYYDDVGFAKLDLGELDAAKSAFVKAHSIVRARGRLAEADAMLNIALALTVKGSAPALIEAGHVIEFGECAYRSGGRSRKA